MKTQTSISGQVLRNLVDEFIADFPKLTDQDHAVNRCKLYAYELCIFLRKRGVRAHIYHVQHIKDKAAWPNAHAQWKDKRPQDWTHYVVRVGPLIIDVTARQLDPDASHPLILRYSELQDMWHTTERDHFISRVANEIQQSRL